MHEPPGSATRKSSAATTPLTSSRAPSVKMSAAQHHQLVGGPHHRSTSSLSGHPSPPPAMPLHYYCPNPNPPPTQLTQQNQNYNHMLQPPQPPMEVVRMMGGTNIPRTYDDMGTLLPPPQSHIQEQVTCRKNLHKMMGISPSDIDKYSRIFFPVTFTCFNLMYWIIYLHVSDEVAEDLMLLHP